MKLLHRNKTRLPSGGGIKQGSGTTSHLFIIGSTSDVSSYVKNTYVRIQAKGENQFKGG